MTTDPGNQIPRSERKGGFPVAGCVLAVFGIVLIFGAAVGGWYRGLIVLGVILVVAAIAAVAFLAKKNSQGGGQM